MRPVLTPAEMAEADATAIAAGVSEAALVERAGGAVARTVRRMLGGTYGRRVLLVAGKGNNGADARVTARLLDAWGVRVDWFELAAGVPQARFARALVRADLAVDGMFGTGLRRPLAGDAAMVAERLASSGVSVLAIDVPSGVDGATGAVAGPAVAADVTVSFAALKPGLLFVPGASYAGTVQVVDIGVDPGSPALGATEASDVAAWIPPRPVDAHKWSVGGVYVVAGGAGMTGAANLTSRAALRAGAGIVVCGLPGEAAVLMSGSEVITRRLAANPEGLLAAEAADEVLAGLDRFRCLVVGPGLGRAPQTVTAVRRLVAGARVPLVLDADGLNALDGDLGPLTRRGPGITVLTPHAGEFERLAGKPVGDDRVEAARGLADRSRAVVLLKGPQTVIADPSGRAAINPTGGPGLASAGTGDVLSGIIGALVARGVPTFEAAAAGAFLHGRAASLGVTEGSGRNPGMVAGDLIDALPRVLPAG